MSTAEFIKSKMAAVTMATGHVIKILNIISLREMFKVHIPSGNNTSQV